MAKHGCKQQPLAKNLPALIAKAAAGSNNSSRNDKVDNVPWHGQFAAKVTAFWYK